MKEQFLNKKALFNYTELDSYSCGIMLIGNEVKSIKSGEVNFVDSYCIFHNNEIWLRGLFISEYKAVNPFSLTYDGKRDRKLLLKKHEINKLNSKVKQNGLTIIPKKIYFNETGLVKVDIMLCKGKNNFDKKESIKNKDIDRDMKRELKY